MRIVFELVAWIDDGLRVFDESALDADPAPLGRECVEGRYRITGDGQPEVVVHDDLFVLAQHLSFSSVAALLDTAHGRYDYRYMTQGHTLSLMHDADVITIEGDAVPRARLDARAYLSQVFACGERFVRLYARAPAADASRLAHLQPFAAAARQALQAHRFDADVVPPPPAQTQAAAPETARWDELWAIVLEPARAEMFYRKVLGSAADTIRFVKMTDATAPAQWVSFVASADRAGLSERLLDSGASCIAEFDGDEIWIDTWGAVFGVKARAARHAAASHELRSPDVERAAHAVAEAFRWRVERNEGSYALCDGERVVCVVSRAEDGQAASWETAIAVDDIELAVAAATAGGAVIERRVAETIWLRDPFGARFGVARR